MKTTQSFYCKAEHGELIFSNKKALKEYLEAQEGKTFFVTFQRERGVRSDNQNRALHKWFTVLADELNAAGYTVQLVLKEKVDLDWTCESVKELLWRPAQKAILGKQSTTQLAKTSDIDEVFEHLNRHIGERFGIHVPFPDDPTN